ncbi:hypothetical protein ANCCAN_18696 [Ancylostoma caninum]|uniref:Uncharacterized protein n=1 Tax=Ancylostoma caninum TaxID=29170 RepID=A0A368FVD2_ANCCA|nr:hypothetical protein ANCCAN_18696 [Ancylostoma caninum]
MTRTLSLSSLLMMCTFLQIRIEMAYAFSNTLNPGITELMLLQNYDGKNPQNLVINVVKSSNCEARLTTVRFGFSCWARM